MVCPQVVTEDLGYKLEKVDLAMLGSAKKVTITKDDTILLHGAGAKQDIAARCEQIREAAEATTSDYDREKLQASGGGEGQRCWVGLPAAV